MVEASENIINCRYYENKYPKNDELVIVEVSNVVENGAYVKLLEYNDIEGLITPSELSKVTNMKSVHKIMRVGRQEVVRVLIVDNEKGYIDLSKKRVQPEEVTECEERYSKSKQVHTIMRTVAEKTKIDLEELYKQIVWPLYNKHHQHALDSFKVSNTDWNKVFGDIQMREDVKEKLQSEIKRRLTPQILKIRADFEITCFAYEGIDAIKEALRAGQKKIGDECEINIISPPLYIVSINTFDKNAGINNLKEALNVIKNVITAKQGSFVIKTEPRVIGEKEEKNIKDLIDDLENKQKERNDSDGEEEEDDGMDADIGVDTEEIDKKNSQLNEEEEEEEKA